MVKNENLDQPLEKVEPNNYIIIYRKFQFLAQTFLYFVLYYVKKVSILTEPFSLLRCKRLIYSINIILENSFKYRFEHVSTRSPLA